MTFATCYYYAFTIWVPTKVVTLGMIICMILYGFQRKSRASSIITSIFSTVIITILICNIIGLLFPGEYAQHINKFVRIFNSSYTYLTTSILLFVGLMMKPGFVRRIFPYYCTAIEVAIAFGLIHYLCLKSGIGFMPILRQDGSTNAEALVQMGNEIIPRLYGVSGEPKSLGFLICPYIVILIVMLRNNYYRINKIYHYSVLVISLFILINTYSSAALINFFIIIPIVLIINKIDRINLKFIGGISIITIALSIFILQKELRTYNKNSPYEESYIAQLYNRTFGRAQNEMENGRQESIILDYYLKDKNLVTKITGWGTSQYTFHVPDQTIGNALIPVQSGLILTIADFGLIGIILLLIIVSIIIKLIKLSIKDSNIISLAFSIAALSSFIGSMMFGSVVSCFIYLMLSIYDYYDFHFADNRINNN